MSRCFCSPVITYIENFNTLHACADIFPIISVLFMFILCLEH